MLKFIIRLTNLISLITLFHFSFPLQKISSIYVISLWLCSSLQEGIKLSPNVQMSSFSIYFKYDYMYHILCLGAQASITLQINTKHSINLLKQKISPFFPLMNCIIHTQQHQEFQGTFSKLYPPHDMLSSLTETAFLIQSSFKRNQDLGFFKPFIFLTTLIRRCLLKKPKLDMRLLASF